MWLYTGQEGKDCLLVQYKTPNQQFLSQNQPSLYSNMSSYPAVYEGIRVRSVREGSDCDDSSKESGAAAAVSFDAVSSIRYDPRTHTYHPAGGMQWCSQFPTPPRFVSRIVHFWHKSQSPFQKYLILSTYETKFNYILHIKRLPEAWLISSVFRNGCFWIATDGIGLN